jgi:hypothetical protein
VPDYVTAYQISKQSFTSFDWLFPYLGVVPLIGAAIIVAGKLRLGWKKPAWPSIPLLCLTGIVASTLSVFLSRQGSKALSAFEAGRYATVEGVVTDFHPMPYAGHGDECFSVNAQRFCYSDYNLAPGFRNTASHGGPIRGGVHVRIAYMGPTILRLEIASDEILSATERQAAADAAMKDSLMKQDSNPVLQGMNVAMSFTTACWCLWASFQWQLAMRFWMRPPNRPTTQSVFRVLFAFGFVVSLIRLARQLYDHPLTRQNAGMAIIPSTIMVLAVGLMTAGALWSSTRSDVAP